MRPLSTSSRDAVVVDLRPPVGLDGDGAHEAFALQDRQGPPGHRPCARYAEQGALLERASGHRDDLEDPSRRVVEPIDARADQIAELDVRRDSAIVVGRRRQIARELLDEEGEAPRLPREPGAVERGVGAAGLQEVLDQGERLLVGERAERNVDSREGPDVGERLQGRAHLPILAAVRQQQEKGGAAGLGQVLAHQRSAAFVAPLRVVDPDDERLPPTDHGEELLERTARLTKSLGAAAPLDAPGSLGDRLHASEHGEDPDQGLGLQRARRRDVCPDLQPEEPAQIVDGAVERVERDGLLRVAPAAEHGGSVEGRLLEEAPRQLALADPGGAVDVNDRRLACAHVVERRGESAQLGVPPLEGRRRRHEGRGSAGRRRVGRGAEPLQDLRAGGAAARLRVEEVRDEIVQILGELRHELAHARCPPAAGEALERVIEGQLAAGGLEERGPDAVPVGRGRHPLAADLLRRHVTHGAGERSIGLRAVRRERDREAEVEQDQAPRLGDHHVRRLDVPMEFHAGVHCGLVSASCRAMSRSGAKTASPRLRAEIYGQVHADDDLHREEAGALLREELVEVDEVRVADVREGTKLLLQVVEVVRRQTIERLERDVRPEVGVIGAVDDAHAAVAEPGGDAKPRWEAARSASLLPGTTG